MVRNSKKLNALIEPPPINHRYLKYVIYYQTLKMSLSTALGMTETLVLGTPDLRTVFSLPVWDTQIQWSLLANEYLRNVLVTMALASANPNREWSVKTVPRPSKLPANKASWANVEKAECPWTIWISSVLNMYFRNGNDPTMVGSAAFV